MVKTSFVISFVAVPSCSACGILYMWGDLIVCNTLPYLFSFYVGVKVGLMWGLCAHGIWRSITW